MKRIHSPCTANACRSQRAEGWARHVHGSQLKGFSAGSEPATVDRRATGVMGAGGIDTPELAQTEKIPGAALDHDRRMRDQLGAWIKTLSRELAHA